MRNSDPLSMNCRVNWGFDPATGASTHPFAEVKSRVLHESIQSVLTAFSMQDLESNGCEFLGELNTLVANFPSKGKDVRQQGRRIWFLFVALEKTTVMIVVRFFEESEEAFLEVTQALNNAVLDIYSSDECIVQQIVDFRLQPPLAIAHKTDDQVFVSVLGTYPVIEPEDALISITAIPVSLFPQQFLGFIQGRLLSLEVDMTAANVSALSNYAFSAKAQIANFRDKAVVARYLFLPKYVICVELTSSSDKYAIHSQQFVAFFESISVRSPEPNVHSRIAASGI